jgi:hypothetical protein
MAVPTITATPMTPLTGTILEAEAFWVLETVTVRVVTVGVVTVGVVTARVVARLVKPVNCGPG